MILSLTEFAGRFHPLLVHLPIGILLVALLLQWLSRRRAYAPGDDALLRVLWVSGAVTAWVSCLTGYLLSLSGEYDQQTVNLHMWMAVGVALVATLICILVFRRQAGSLLTGSSLLLLLLITAAGHLGGSLTHGSGYLTAALDNSDAQTNVAQKIIPDIQEARAYADVVEPLLQSKCYGCHGASKQKGALRLDGQEWLLKGGKEGPAIRAGKADESELIKRLLLAREEEHHMPPKEKPQLTERQVALLHWWVEQGADFSKKVKELSQPDKMQPVLLSFQENTQQKIEPGIPDEPVEAAGEEALALLRNRSVVVLPVAQNSFYLMANFVMATGVTDADMKLLLPLKKQLVWLKAGGTPIGDQALQIISQCTQITRLQLNGTRITDQGLSRLRSLTHLQSLNLVNTGISLQGLLPLQSLQKLQSIYLYQTRVDRSRWKELRQAFPRVQLDTGGYAVPYFATDTTLMKPPEQQ